MVAIFGTLFLGVRSGRTPPGAQRHRVRGRIEKRRTSYGRVYLCAICGVVAHTLHDCGVRAVASCSDARPHTDVYVRPVQTAPGALMRHGPALQHHTCRHMARAGTRVVQPNILLVPTTLSNLHVQGRVVARQSRPLVADGDSRGSTWRLRVLRSRRARLLPRAGRDPHAPPSRPAPPSPYLSAAASRSRRRPRVPRRPPGPRAGLVGFGVWGY